MRYIVFLFISILVFADEKFSIEFGQNHTYYSDDRYKDDRFYIQTVIPADDYTLVLMTEKLDKFHQSNNNIHAELYKSFSDKKSGYISLSYSPDATFLPIYDAGIYGYIGIDSFEVGLGYQYSHYTSRDINMFIPEYTYYLNDNYYFTQTLYLVPQNGSWAISNRLHYDNQNIKSYIEYIHGSSKEQVNTPNQWDKLKENSFIMHLEYLINSYWSIGGDFKFSDLSSNNLPYNAKQINLFIKKSW